MKKLFLTLLIILLTAPSALAYTFPATLKQGSRGEDVRQLQILLNQDPATQVATTGIGSK
ncbi:MAG: hypothetical protein HZB12_02965 [Candidatus Yonathbacteria bacterium]|nr:hypothetical protein [Candidatus Yonathbacteria bacterium]